MTSTSCTGLISATISAIASSSSRSRVMAKSDEQDYDWLIPLTTRHSGTLTHPHFWGSIAAVRRLNGFLGSGVDSPPAAPHREGIAVGERGNWCRWEGWDSQPPVEGGAGVPWGLSRQDSAPRTSSSRKRFRQRWCNLRHPSSSGRVGRARHSVSPARKSVLYVSAYKFATLLQ